MVEAGRFVDGLKRAARRDFTMGSDPIVPPLKFQRWYAIIMVR